MSGRNKGGDAGSMDNILRPCSEKQSRMLKHDADVLFIGG